MALTLMVFIPVSSSNSRCNASRKGSCNLTLPPGNLNAPSFSFTNKNLVPSGSTSGITAMTTTFWMSSTAVLVLFTDIDQSWMFRA